MESGFVKRGVRRGISQCSLMFMGNVNVKGEIPIEDFTYVLPETMRDAAFIDRVHGFVSGWEVPKIGKLDVHIPKNYGFVTDYFAEILHELRKRMKFYYHVSDKVELSNVTGRDGRAVKRVASGFLKLITPHGEESDKDQCLVGKEGWFKSRKNSRSHDSHYRNYDLRAHFLQLRKSSYLNFTHISS